MELSTNVLFVVILKYQIYNYICMETGLKQFDKYIKTEDLIGSSYLMTIEEEDD